MSIEKYLNPPFLGSSWRCSCGRRHSIATREVICRRGALNELPDLLERLRLSRDVCLVYDPNTFRAAGRKVKALMAGRSMEWIMVHPDRTGLVSPNEKTARWIKARVPRRAKVLVAVGSGVINDLVKYVSFKRRLPYVAVATAPSMNGYTSTISAITVKGLKHTSGAQLPIAVVADTDVLRRAPIDMIRAGIADFLARSLANSDWKLAHIIKGEYYCRMPLKMLQAVEPRFIRHVARMVRRDAEAVELLIKGLLVSGFSMAVAGSSAPASGGEHLISHFLDLMMDVKGKRHYALHGLQVSQGCLVSTRVYEELFKLKTDDIDVERLISCYQTFGDVSRDFKRFYNRAAGEVTAEFRAKYLSMAEKRRELMKIRRQWAGIKRRLKGDVISHRCLSAVFAKARIPLEPQKVGIDPVVFQQAVFRARQIRRRYTVLDLASDLGLI